MMTNKPLRPAHLLQASWLLGLSAAACAAA